MQSITRIHLIGLALAFFIVAGGVLFLLFGGGGRVLSSFSAHIGVGSERVYENKKHGFSLSYPEAFTVVEYLENDPDIILFGDAWGEALEIAVFPFDEPAVVLTEERIHQDLPDFPMDNVAYVELDNDIQALSFSQLDAENRVRRSVWFLYEGFLYQLNGRAGFDDILDDAVRTFSFNQ